MAWLWADEAGKLEPLCHFHADERVHDAIPYGRNCSRCGVDHSALWPSGELEPDRCPDCGHHGGRHSDNCHEEV